MKTAKTRKYKVDWTPNGVQPINSSYKEYKSFIIVFRDKIIDYKLFDTDKTVDSYNKTIDFKIYFKSLGKSIVTLYLPENTERTLIAYINLWNYLIIKWYKNELWIQKKSFWEKIIFSIIVPIIVAFITTKCIYNDANHTPNKEDIIINIKSNTVNVDSSS